MAAFIIVSHLYLYGVLSRRGTAIVISELNRGWHNVGECRTENSPRKGMRVRARNYAKNVQLVSECSNGVGTILQRKYKEG